MAKIGRNDPCPCGSGRKHKKCCFESAASSAPQVAAAATPTKLHAPHEHVCSSCGSTGRAVVDLDADEINDRADHILDELLDGHVDDAETLCHDFIEDLPGEAEGFDLLSMVFEERGQRERALDLLRKASAIAHAKPEYDAETRRLMRQRIKELELQT